MNEVIAMHFDSIRRRPARALALAVAVTLCNVALALAPAGDVRAATTKNWTPPANTIYAQALVNATMADHPELLSVTLHGTPPGVAAGTYTMFAGSYHDRIGNADDPDDIDVSVKGITIVDPRWHRTNDTVKKFVVLEPLRDAAGENVGLVVYAFKNDAPGRNDERKYTLAAMDLRDALATRIPSYEALFAESK